MLPSIAKLASKHGLKPLKKYGQNFIFDESLCDKIVQYANIDNKSKVLEIGPGPCGLTRSLLKKNIKQITVIETDERCLPILEEIRKSYSSPLIIKHDDALKVRLDSIYTNTKIDIISNLPYNIGTQLLLNWISQIQYVNSMTLMLQKEVVDRIISQPNKKSYGRLSVISQLTCNVSKCFDVSPKTFYPEPKIWSSVIRFLPKEKRYPADILHRLEKITNLAFSGRRKMIKSSLKTLTPDIEDFLRKINIKPEFRAENLSPEDYILIAKNLYRHC